MALLAGLGPAWAQENCPLEAGPQAHVAQAIDGETLLLADGAQVRLLNVLGARSAEEALASLAGGRDAQLFFDGRRKDRRGRWLAHVFVTRGQERLWVQARLVEAGHARVVSFAKARACARRLQAFEQVARTRKAGLWRGGDAVPAWQTKRLLAQVNRFQIVEGRVAEVAKTRRWTFVNFDADWRSDFTVAVAAADRRRFRGSDVELGALKGARLRVRGWVERWNGPVLKVTHPEQIELLEAPAEATSAQDIPQKNAVRPGLSEGD